MTVKRMGALLLAAVFGVGGCSSLPDEEVYPVDITIGESRQRTQAAVLEERYPPRSLLSPSSPR